MAELELTLNVKLDHGQLQAIHDHIESIGQQIMSDTQGQADQIETAITDLDTTVTTEFENLSQSLSDDTSALQQALTQAQSSGVDLSGVQTALDTLTSDLGTANDNIKSKVDAVTALVPAQPAPQPAPAPAPDQPPSA